MPREKELIPLDGYYSELDVERMMKGIIPKDMDDKWFIYYRDGWLYFHRSWTGFCIFQVKLSNSKSGKQITEAWVNRDKTQYDSDGIEEDAFMLSQAIQCLILHNVESV